MNTDKEARNSMRRRYAWVMLAASIAGCSGDDPDDVAEVKTAMPLDNVPAAVMDAARKVSPDLTFYAAYKGKYQGKDSIELKGKTRTGKIHEVEVSPEGVVLGTE